jgi:hypothetical protein
MDDPETDELRRLRARAYGPDADIAADPRAQARLAELEAERRAPVDVQSADPVPSGAGTAPAAPEITEASVTPPPAEPPAPASLSSASEGGEPSATAHADAPPPAPTRSAASLRRRVILAWAASLALVGVVVAIVTNAITAPDRALDEPRDIVRIATLHTDKAFVPPVSYESSSAKVSGFDEFHGLTAMAIRGWLGVANAPCLLIVDTDELNIDSGILDGDTYYGCSAGEFPATVTVRVDSRLPDGIREMFADGTGLQFVLRGDDVIVAADHAPTAAPTTTYLPAPRVTPLAIPLKADGELTRAVVHPDDNGDPAVTAYLSSPPQRGVVYAVDAACTATRRGVEMTFELRSTGTTAPLLEGGDVKCNGPAVRITGKIIGDKPPRVVFTGTDGVRDGYVVVAPAS